MEFTGNLYLHSHERKSVINFVLTAVFPPFCVNQYGYIDTVSWTTPPLWQADNDSENIKKRKKKRKQWTKKQSEKPRTRATMGGGGVDNALTTGEQTIPPPILFRNNPPMQIWKEKKISNSP